MAADIRILCALSSALILQIMIRPTCHCDFSCYGEEMGAMLEKHVVRHQGPCKHKHASVSLPSDTLGQPSADKRLSPGARPGIYSSGCSVPCRSPAGFTEHC